jgi:hypothetical protein
LLRSSWRPAMKKKASPICWNCGDVVAEGEAFCTQCLDGGAWETDPDPRDTKGDLDFHRDREEGFA